MLRETNPLDNSRRPGSAEAGSSDEFSRPVVEFGRVHGTELAIEDLALTIENHRERQCAAVVAEAVRQLDACHAGQADREADRQPGEVLAHRCRAVEGEPDDAPALRLLRAIEAVEQGHFLEAWRAPSCPEVDQQGLAAQRRHRELTAAGLLEPQTPEGEFGAVVGTRVRAPQRDAGAGADARQCDAAGNPCSSLHMATSARNVGDRASGRSVARPHCAGRSPYTGPLALRFIRPPPQGTLAIEPAGGRWLGRIALVDPRIRGPSPFASY